jgi:hypothetical protein
MSRLAYRHEPGLGPSLTAPKKTSVALAAIRWRYELIVASASASAVSVAVVWTGLDHTLVGVACLAVAACAACTRPNARRLVVQRFWLIATPHRVRTCFARAWVYNQHGQIPSVLRAVAAPGGERVIIWLRAGIGFADIESATDLLAAACFATEVIANRDRRYGHLVYLDVIRWPERELGAGGEVGPAGLDATGRPDSGPQRPRLYGLPSDDWADNPDGPEGR